MKIGVSLTMPMKIRDYEIAKVSAWAEAEIQDVKQEAEYKALWSIVESQVESELEKLSGGNS